MKSAGRRVAIGIVGLTLGATTARLLRRPAARSDDHLHMPDELLLTFTHPTETPSSGDSGVQTLLQHVSGLAGGGTLRAVDKAVSPDIRPDGTPLTLRVRTQGASAGPRGRYHVRRMADRINSHRHHLQHQGVTVSSAMPNWIISSSGTGVHGGPGTVPDPAPHGDWRFVVPPAGVWPPQGIDAAPDPRVVVAVLDTSPGREQLHRAAARTLYQENGLLQRLADENTAHAITFSGHFTPPDDVPARRHNCAPDHGIFVAGVIHDIAPHAEIQLLHVLDEKGFGRTDLLLDALDYCLSLARRGRRVVVNLSLYLMIPPRDGLWAHWFGPLDRLLAMQPARRAALLAPLDEAVQRRIELLLDAGVVVVAAAGNDALAYRRHPEPRLPADYSGVLCVVATDRDGKIAAYSNRGDLPPTGNSVATYGGQGMLHGAASVVPPGVGVEPRDGVVGLYTHHEVVTTDGPKPNESGWVYWSGTSFATPIISALAANVLARNELEQRADPTIRPLTPRGVMSRILAMAAPAGATDPALGCPYVPVTQRR